MQAERLQRASLDASPSKGGSTLKDETEEVLCGDRKGDTNLTEEIAGGSSSESERNEDEDSILWTNNKFSALRKQEFCLQ